MGNCAACYQTNADYSNSDPSVPQCNDSDENQCDPFDLHPNPLHMHRTQHNQMMGADLGIFEKDENQCDAMERLMRCDAMDRLISEYNYTTCDAMERLIGSSQHYSMLKMKKSEDYDDIFTRFMNDMYNSKGNGLIDDYIHFQQHHEHELERINRELRESNRFSDCTILECEYTRRHMDEPSTSCTDTSDSKLQFYEDTFDALHFHLFHCFEAGLRVRMRDDNDEMEE
eukprot:452671_1